MHGPGVQTSPICDTWVCRGRPCSGTVFADNGTRQVRFSSISPKRRSGAFTTATSRFGGGNCYRRLPGDPDRADLTDEMGHFHAPETCTNGAPKNSRSWARFGKWRRQIKIASIAAFCKPQMLGAADTSPPQESRGLTTKTHNVGRSAPESRSRRARRRLARMTRARWGIAGQGGSRRMPGRTDSSVRD